MVIRIAPTEPTVHTGASDASDELQHILVGRDAFPTPSVELFGSRFWESNRFPVGLHQ